MILIPLTLLHFTAFNVFFGAIPGIRVKVIPLLANYVSFVETRFHDDSPWAAIGEVYYQEYGFVALSAVLLAPRGIPIRGKFRPHDRWTQDRHECTLVAARPRSWNLSDRCVADLQWHVL